jgi:hypothetical protein
LIRPKPTRVAVPIEEEEEEEVVGSNPTGGMDVCLL